MKSSLFRILPVLIVSLFTLNKVQAETVKSPFIGTWQLVSGEYVDANKKVIDYIIHEITSQKVINQSHFAFVSLSKGKFWGAGSGKYTFTNSEYIETPTFVSYPLEDDGVYAFKYTLENDLWKKSRWRNNERVEYEVWKRVK